MTQGRPRKPIEELAKHGPRRTRLTILPIRLRGVGQRNFLSRRERAEYRCPFCPETKHGFVGIHGFQEHLRVIHHMTISDLMETP